MVAGTARARARGARRRVGAAGARQAGDQPDGRAGRSGSAGVARRAARVRRGPTSGRSAAPGAADRATSAGRPSGGRAGRARAGPDWGRTTRRSRPPRSHIRPLGDARSGRSCDLGGQAVGRRMVGRPGGRPGVLAPGRTGVARRAARVCRDRTSGHSATPGAADRATSAPRRATARQRSGRHRRPGADGSGPDDGREARCQLAPCLPSGRGGDQAPSADPGTHSPE